MESIVRKVIVVAAMVLAVIFGVGAILLFALAPHEAKPFVRLPGGPSWALVWDTAVSLIFFVQHSGMVRKPVRARLARIVPADYFGAMYSVASGVALVMVVVFWQPAGAPLFVLHGPARLFMGLLGAASVAGFVWGAVSLKGFDMLGLRPLRARLRGEAAPVARLMVRGPYRWVRHPLYTFVIVLIWSNAEVGPDGLLFNLLWTAWIWLGATLEERDLTDELGSAYQAYRRRVPMLLPWRRPIPPFVE